jgi:DNA-binding MarR family transcriptional regulator
MILSITEKGKRKIEILSPLEEEINRTMEETLTRKDIRDLRALLLKLEKGMMDW